MGDKRINILLLWAVDIGLAASVVLVPAIMGGRVAIGQLVLVSLAFWVAGCWCLRQCFTERGAWFRSPADILILAALAFVGIQLVPLPPALLETLSPNIYKPLPLWSPHNETAAALGVWKTLSLAPAAGRQGFVLITAFALLFLTAVQRLKRLEDIERLLRVVAVTTIGLAGLAFLQYLFGNGKYFWLYDHPLFPPKPGVQGSFTNRNHFAQFIALGIGPVIWWAFDGLRDSQRERTLLATLRFLALSFVVFVGLMSLSRGGAVCILLAVTIFTLIVWRGSLIANKTALALAGAAILTGALLYTYGLERVSARLDDLTSLEELDKNSSRRGLWLSDIRAAGDFAIAGTGLCSHREVCPMYHADERTFNGIEYTHAENGYVQVTLEGGAIGLFLAMSAVSLCVYWCVNTLYHKPSPRIRLCIAAVASGLSANFLHSLSDFVWYIPGCMAIAVMLAAAACRLCRLTVADKPSTSVEPPNRLYWALSAVCLVPAACLMIHAQLQAVRGESHWHRYLAMNKEFQQLDKAERYRLAGSMARELEAVIEYQPCHYRAHCNLAGVHLQLFNDNPESETAPLDVRQVRDAAIASNFESPAKLGQWLSRAFGNRAKHLRQAWLHSRTALANCPLQGEAYLYLAQLCFMENSRLPEKHAYIEQALAVRPYDTAVVLEAGNEALMEGDLQKTCSYWKKMFDKSDSFRKKLTARLAPRVDAAFFIETFQPDLAALTQLGDCYRQAGRRDDYLFVTKRSAKLYAEKARVAKGEKAAGLWTQAASLYARSDDPEKRLACLQEAVRCDSANYQARYTLGKCYYGRKDYEAAAEQLKWCMRERPFDQTLRALVESALNKQLRLGKTPG